MVIVNSLYANVFRPITVLPPTDRDYLRTAIGRFIKIGRWHVGSRAVAGRVLESGS